MEKRENRGKLYQVEAYPETTNNYRYGQPNYQSWSQREAWKEGDWNGDYEDRNDLQQASRSRKIRLKSHHV